jgi:predicted nucleotidyltransferase
VGEDRKEIPVSQPAQDDPVIRQLLGKLEDLRARIAKIVLFGSRARGDHKPRSDYDVLLIVDKRDQTLVDRIYDSVMEVEDNFFCDLSLKIIAEREWERRRTMGSRFVANVAREGIVLG